MQPACKRHVRLQEPSITVPTLVEGGGNGNVYVRFYCGFYSVDVAVAFLNHFLTVGRQGVNVCRTNITIRQFPLPLLFY
jgi:hypothetical protein